MWLIKRLFHDKRCTVGLLLLWMVTVCTIFYVLGAFHMGYMHVGPSEDTVFMGLKIDNWTKWMALAIFSFCNTGINEFISNALDPWFVNSLQDHKTRSIEYSHATCLWIVQIHCIYVHVMGVFALFLFFSQVDFAIIRLLADLLVTGYSTVWFIQNKRVVAAAAPSSHEHGSDQHLMTDHRSNYDDDNDDELHCPSASVMLDLSSSCQKRFTIRDDDDDDDADDEIASSSQIPASDDSLMEDAMLPLSLSATSENEVQKKKRKSRQKAQQHHHSLGRLPLQTTASQRNEDTRP